MKHQQSFLSLTDHVVEKHLQCFCTVAYSGKTLHAFTLPWGKKAHLDAEGEVCRRSVQFTAVHHSVDVQIIQISHVLQVTRLLHENTQNLDLLLKLEAT